MPGASCKCRGYAALCKRLKRSQIFNDLICLVCKHDLYLQLTAVCTGMRQRHDYDADITKREANQYTRYLLESLRLGNDMKELNWIRVRIAGEAVGAVLIATLSTRRLLFSSRRAGAAPRTFLAVYVLTWISVWLVGWSDHQKSLSDHDGPQAAASGVAVDLLHRVSRLVLLWYLSRMVVSLGLSQSLPASWERA
jgi:hypothetical protein